MQSLSGRAPKLDVIEERLTPDLDRERHGDESGRSSSETDERRQRYFICAITYTRVQCTCQLSIAYVSLWTYSYVFYV